MRMLWGGASASSQYEGGFDLFNKGIDTQDCRRYVKRTDNATTSTRLLTNADIERAKHPLEGDFFPGRNHRLSDFWLFLYRLLSEVL